MPPPPSPEAPEPTLPAELLEEIFLRLPPDEPAWLVRASLASKLWLGLLTGAAFRGRYHEFHGSPPMLGFFHFSSPSGSGPPFVPTAKFAGAGFPYVQDEDWIGSGWHKHHHVLGCRHGRVLLSNVTYHVMMPSRLVGWDPMTGRRRELRAPKDYDSHKAAVLCNVTGCDHHVCHEGPFRFVFIGLEINEYDACVAYAHVSLPEVGEWSKPCSLHLPTTAEDACFAHMPPVFIQDALYFMLDDDYGAHSIAILKYDLSSNRLSLIDVLPLETGLASHAILMALEDGSLGFAHLEELTLNLWSRHVGSDGVTSWPCRRVFNLETLLPIRNPKEKLGLIGSVEGSDIIFLTMDLGIYEINLKSLRWKKIWKREKCHILFPYMSFYNPPERVSPSDETH